METKMNSNAVNQFVKGTEIFTEGNPVFNVALILKGRVSIHNDGAVVILSTGTFLGINDLYSGRYQSSYTAEDDVLLYIFAISSSDELEGILSINKDYHGFMVAAYNKLIYELDNIYQGITKLLTEIYQFLTENYKEYIASAEILDFKEAAEKRLNTFSLPESEMEMIRDSINYYSECRNLPIDVVKTFYSYGNAITIYQVEDQVNVINRQMEALRGLSKGLVKLVEGLVDDSDTCLFQLVASYALEVESAATGEEAMNVMDNIIDEVNKAEKFIDRMTGRRLHVDRKKMEEVYHTLLTGKREAVGDSGEQSKYSAEDVEHVLADLRDSYHTILDFSGIDKKRAEEMIKSMQDFIDLKDKASAEDTARALRRKMTDQFYELYKEVFLKAYKHEKLPRVIELFLQYGYAEEKLLTREQLGSLYYLKEEKKSTPCNVYNIREWLTLIYEGKKEPSKNEFDMEYPEMVIGLKKQGRIKEKEAKEWLTSSERKLEYEIQNMFRYNNKLANGQISTFVPVLHQEILMGNDFERAQLTPAGVNEAIQALLKIDYSIFSREVLYANKEKNIVKEYIIKQVYPDIILMPTVGTNGVMWQEITGKRRDSSGRFLLPAFMETTLNTMLVKVFGRFRWEMCRSIEGIAWNDIKHKSLTSEYCDYLQFYRRNRELSEETKEKIKHQIQKGRNSSREIFVIDYEQWINYEYMGAIKLNKLVRELMATYCPFARETRERIKQQPLFEEAMARFNRERQKKIREIESRHRALQRDMIEVTQELEDTLTYYKET